MENSKIQWTDHTFNPWEGCTKVSPGCAHCYAETLNHRWGKDNWGKGKPRRRTSAANWRQPLKWNQNAARLETMREANNQAHDPPRVFCASLADWLDDEVPIEWLADLLNLIRDTPNLDWLLLTKRPENFETRFNLMLDTMCRKSFPRPEPLCKATAMLEFWRSGEPPENVWLGTSVEDQQRAQERIPQLIGIPARIRFLSCEPLLEGLDLARASGMGAIEFSRNVHWAIFGGESGHDARPCRVDWIRDGVQQCRAACVAPFVKQLGSNIVGNEMDKWVTRVRDKKGGDISEWPSELHIREFPKHETVPA